MHEDRNINQQIVQIIQAKKSIEFYVTSVALLDQDSTEYTRVFVGERFSTKPHVLAIF